MDRIVPSLAALYVALLPLGRSGLPLHAQWGDLLFPLLAVAAIRTGGPGFRPRREDWPLALYLGVTLVTALFSPDPFTGLQELAKQTYVACIFLVFRPLCRDPALRGRFLRIFVLAVAPVTTVSIVAVFLLVSGSAPLSLLGWAGGPLPFFGLVLRLRGAFEAPEFLGNALSVAFVLSLGLRAIAPEGSRLFWTAIATLLAAGEFLTFSHSVAGFCVAAAFFTAGSMLSRALRSLCWGGALGVALVVNAASVVTPVQRDLSGSTDIRALSFNLLGTRVDAQLDHYALLKRVAWSAFIEHPVTGIGPGRFVGETRRAYAEGRLTPRQSGLVPHSSPFGRLAESGVPGGISLLLLWASWIRGCGPGLAVASPLRRAAFAAVLGLLVNSLNADVMNFRFLWIALAWAWLPGSEPGTASDSSARP